MSDVEELINEEAEASETNPDAPVPAEAAMVSRPSRGRSTVYSIRLNPDEVVDLQALADAADVPALPWPGLGSSRGSGGTNRAERRRGGAQSGPASPGPSAAAPP